jgi:hypothetical protein
MAAPTSITVKLDLEEYSKFEKDRRTMTVFWTAAGGGNMSGQVLLLELRKARRSRDGIAFSKNITIIGTADPASGTTSIDLKEDCVDNKFINTIRRGYYFVRLSSVSNTSVYGVSPDVPISIMTPAFLQQQFMFGLPLEAREQLTVKFQPTNITGVEVLEVSQTHPTGFCPLTFIYNTTPSQQQISWGAGPVVPLTVAGRYLLKYDCNGTDYMVIQIRNMSALPSSGQTDELLVCHSKITDAMMRRWIEQACDWLENDKIAGVFLEPTRIVTDVVQPGNVQPDWDLIVPPITFYAAASAKWIDIYVPYMWLLKLDRLYGQIADTEVIDVSLQWAEISERNGMVQLVPFNSATSFQYIGLTWVSALSGPTELPNFWHFNAIAGLREVDPILLEIIGKKAAMDALTQAGHAYRGGFSSQSISRDGVSESVSYTASAIYGIYAATIEDYNKFLNREVKQIKGRYRGLNVVVL